MISVYEKYNISSNSFSVGIHYQQFLLSMLLSLKVGVISKLGFVLVVDEMKKKMMMLRMEKEQDLLEL